jgi:hypothetical protein
VAGYLFPAPFFRARYRGFLQLYLGPEQEISLKTQLLPIVATLRKSILASPILLSFFLSFLTALRPLFHFSYICYVLFFASFGFGSWSKLPLEGGAFSIKKRIHGRD